MFDQCIMKLIWSFFRTKLDYLGKSRGKKMSRGMGKELILFRWLEWNSFHGVWMCNPLKRGSDTDGATCKINIRNDAIQAANWKHDFMCVCAYVCCSNASQIDPWTIMRTGFP